MLVGDLCELIGQDRQHIHMGLGLDSVGWPDWQFSRTPREWPDRPFSRTRGNGQTCQTGNSAEPQGNGKTGLSSEPQGKAIVVKMLDLVSKPSCILHLVAVYQSVLTSVHSWASMQQSHFQ